MEVADVARMLPNGANHIPFHDLHMVDVVKQLHPRRIHAFHHLRAEGRVVALIVVVIDLAVQQLHTDRDAMMFGERRDAAQTRDTRLDALCIRAPLPVPEHRDEIRDALGRRKRQRALELADQEVVIGWIIEAARDEIVADHGIAHRADEPAVTNHGPFFRRQQVDGR